MVTLADIIRAEKTNIQTGEWNSGKIPRSAFPLTKGTRSIPMGPNWKWRLCTFEALGFQCRVLIRLNTERAYYHAVLGIEVDGKFRVACHHELHLPDKGWHCHFAPGCLKDVFPGVMRDYNLIRSFEAAPSKASSTEFNVTCNNALTLAALRYRFQKPGGFL